MKTTLSILVNLKFFLYQQRLLITLDCFLLAICINFMPDINNKTEQKIKFSNFSKIKSRKQQRCKGDFIENNCIAVQRDAKDDDIQAQAKKIASGPNNI